MTNQFERALHQLILYFYTFAWHGLFSLLLFSQPKNANISTQMQDQTIPLTKV